MMRRYIILGVLLLFTGGLVLSQTTQQVEGTVSFKSSQNVYVKFNNTSGIQAGDTLFILREGKLIPALEAKYVSSTSVMGVPLSDITLELSDVVVSVQSVKVSAVAPEELPVPAEVPPVPEPEPEKPVAAAAQQEQARSEDIRGRLSVSMYHNMYDGTSPDVQRLRYVFSMRAKHIGDSRLSAETYVSYRHQFEDWSPVAGARTKALRLYSLAMRYDFDDGTSILLGRRVNTNVTNIGAIDGLQAEHTAGKFVFGGFAGSRPDYVDYGLNTQLVQYGGFVGFRTKSTHGTTQSSLAIVEQRNNHSTDRRFAYVQHSGMLSKSISVFASAEFDLYMRVDSVPMNAIHLTSTYLSLQYRPSHKLTLYGSYDARKNVIYYETYQNFIDNLLEQEMRQGLRFRAMYRAFKYVTMGSTIGYRFQKAQGSTSMNMQYYLTHSRIPWLKASGTASVIYLKNDYLKGAVYGIRLYRDIIKKKVFGELEYRMVDYRYGLSETTLHQDIFGANISWRIRKKLSLGLDYEGVFSDRSSSRIHVNLVQRF